MIQRRDFLRRTLTATAATAGVLAAGSSVLANAAPTPSKLPFKISLAQWSLHRTLRKKDNPMDNLDFAMTAKKEFGIEAVEYVNQFFKDKAKDQKYLTEMNQRAEDHGVRSLLIMVDGEGKLGDPNADARTKAIENHYKWVEAAKFLGCHSIRVNAGSGGSYEEQQKLAADGLRRLSQFAAPMGMNVIVENHGGLSSNGAWLAGTIQQVGMVNCGTLPDFGNFYISRGKNPEVYNRYKGVKELMPYAKAVSAKTHGFDDKGNETSTDYFKMMDIVMNAGYFGYVGIEWEGGGISEFEGIRKSKALLERVGAAV